MPTERREIPFVGGAYKGRSTFLNPQECVNFFPDVDTKGGKSQRALIGTPGLDQFASLGSNAAVRNMILVDSYVYAMMGNQLRRIASDGTITDITGTIGTSDGFVFMAHDGQGSLVIVDPGQDGYLFRAQDTISATFDADTAQGETFTADASTDKITLEDHGFSDADVVSLVTSDTLPDPLSTGIGYFVRDATTDTFKLALTEGGTAINLTDSGTGTHRAILSAHYGDFTADAETDDITSTAHGMKDGQQVRLVTTDTLPAGLAVETTYYVVNASTDVFQLSATLGGAAINITDAGTGTHTFWAMPSTRVITSSGHGLADGHTIQLTTSNTLPAGLATSTTYFIRDSTTNTFNLSASLNGPPIDVTDGGTGTHTWTSVLEEIADDDFPVPTSLTFTDGYFVVSKSETGEFYISGSYDPTSWDATDYATAEFKADDLSCVFAHRRALLLIGDETTESWYNSGASAFPFDPISGALIPYGTAARASVAEGDNAVFMVSKSRDGAILALRISGVQPTRISTTQIEYQWAQYSSVADAVGFFYTQEGHGFYVVTFPTGDATWVYDALTDEWHERRSWPALPTGDHGKHRCNCYVYAFGKHLVGDHSNGDVYEWDLDTWDDYYGEIIRIRVAQPIHANGKRVRFANVQVDFEPGVGTGAGTDKVSNGGFDSATTGWTAGNDATLSSESGGKDGNCLKVLENGTENPYAYQAIDVISGWEYTLFAYIKAGDEATYQVKVYDVDNDTDLFDSAETEETAGDWSTEETQAITIPDTCSQIQIQLYQIASAAAGTYVLFDSVSFYATQGQDPQAMLYWSNDGGVTFSDPVQRDIGQTGEYENRAIWRKLGSARNRVFKLQVSDPVKTVITGAYADIEVLNH